MPIVPIAMALMQFAPSLMKIFGANEPTVAAADKVISIAQAITNTDDPVAALKNLQANTELQIKFDLEIQANAKEIELAYLRDTQSARWRDVELAKAGIKNYRANVLIAIAFTIVVLTIGLMVWASDASDFIKGSITFLMGTATGWINQAFNFEFGTTRSSTKKDDTINTLSNQ